VNAATILVAEDDRKTAGLLRLYLEHAGYRVVAAVRGDDALRVFRREEPDLVLLDRMLPGLSGDAVCRALRAEGDVPVIFVTARAGEEERLHGLGWGADDYVTKPFSPREVVARVRAVLRRSGARESTRLRRWGPLAIDGDGHALYLDGREVPLTPAERRLMQAFIAARGVALDRRTLAEKVFREDSEALDRTIDAHVMKVRRKLHAADPESRVVIETVFGVGYRLVADGDRR